MDKADSRNSTRQRPVFLTPWCWVVAGSVMLLILALLLPKLDPLVGRQGRDAGLQAEAKVQTAGTSTLRKKHSVHRKGHDQTASAAEIVAAKLSQFARGRRDIAQRMAKHFGVE